MGPFLVSLLLFSASIFLFGLADSLKRKTKVYEIKQLGVCKPKVEKEYQCLGCSCSNTVERIDEVRNAEKN